MYQRIAFVCQRHFGSRVALSFFLILLTQCTSSQVREYQSTSAPASTAPPQAPNRFSILFTTGRHLDAEPCGCSLNPLGGIDREWKLRTKWAAEGTSFLSVSAGTNFVPYDFSPKNRAFYLKKADLLIEALNAMGVEIVSPSYEEFAFGRSQVDAWRRATRFAWVSANLFERGSRKPIFPVSAEHEFGHNKVTVLGVTGCRVSSGFAPDKMVQCRPVVPSLRAALTRIAPNPGLVVLLASLKPGDLEAVRKAFPQINVILNSDEENVEQEVVQWSPSQLYVSPFDRGRAVVRLDFDGSEPVHALYSSHYSLKAKAKIDDIEGELAALETKLKGKLSAPARRHALHEQSAWREKLASEKAVWDIDSAKAMHFEAETTLLDESFNEPTNPMGLLLDRFKKATHDIAVQAADDGE